MPSSKNVVLLVYNSVLFLLHGYAFGYTLFAGASLQFDYSSISNFLLFITSLQYLDIIFSFFLTKSNPVAVFIQVSGRLLVLWTAGYTIRWTAVVFTLVTVYLLSELCRGPFYLANCLGSPNDNLTWLRYNAFKVLYPIGFTCEGLVFANFFLSSGSVSVQSPSFFLVLIFPFFFAAIVWFLYTSMSKSAAKKNKELQRAKSQ
ncbi:unnamed protein product [Caenorhabditis sp. 36 PRJEB53466]|nr:unnamed protein product [Caenorhabditis sp. 36 PRJEB53466]